MNVSVEAMSATRTRLHNQSVIASSYCNSSTEFVGHVQPRHEQFYKAALPGDRLGEVPGILKNANDTIVITKVRSCGCTGILQYSSNNDTVWQGVIDLRPGNALVLGKENSLR